MNTNALAHAFDLVHRQGRTDHEATKELHTMFKDSLDFPEAQDAMSAMVALNAAEATELAATFFAPVAP